MMRIFILTGDVQKSRHILKMRRDFWCFLAIAVRVDNRNFQKQDEDVIKKEK